MKKEETISALLGVTQHEMAMLLQINPSQWSMYESGKRSLPATAMQQLSEMLQQVQSTNAKLSKKQWLLSQQEDKMKQTLETLLRENQYQQLVMERKIVRIQKKQSAALATIQLLDFLTNHTDKKTEQPHLLQSMETKAHKKAIQNDEAVLITHQIKHEVLKYEAELLKITLTGLVAENTL